MKTVMKKIVIAIVSMLMILLTVSCGSAVSGGNKLYGRWDAVGVNADGTELTMDEVKAMGDDSMDDFYFIIKEGGKAYVHVQDEGDLVDWEETENGVKIGVREFVYEREKLALEMNGNKIYFEKTSNDQTIIGDSEKKQMIMKTLNMPPQKKIMYLMRIWTIPIHQQKITMMNMP